MLKKELSESFLIIALCAVSLVIIGAPRPRKLQTCNNNTREIINVRDSKFSDLNSTLDGDDTATIQRALLSAHSCSALYFPAGTYHIGKPSSRVNGASNIKLPATLNDFVIFGAGKDKKGNFLTKIVYTVEDQSDLITLPDWNSRYANSLLILEGGNEIRILDIAFSAYFKGKENFGSKNTNGIWAQSTNNLLLNNVKLEGFDSFGLLLGNNNTSNSPRAQNITISNTDFVSNRVAGIGLANADKVFVNSSSFKLNGVPAKNGQKSGIIAIASASPGQLTVNKGRKNSEF